MQFALSELGKLCVELVPQRFAKTGCSVDIARNPIIKFAAAHPDVGDLTVYDDGEDLTIYVGDITHVHFGCYEDDWSEDRKRLAIVDDVSHFVREVITEEIELFKTSFAGGFAPRGEGKGLVLVWTGPLRDDRRARRWRFPFIFWQ